MSLLDLTVETAHTFYVDTGTGPVLVHNADCGPIDPTSVVEEIDAKNQARHLAGDPEQAAGGGGYMNSIEDAQKVLDDFHNGKTQILGRSRAGNILVQDDGVTGFNNNARAGYLDQPTNRFYIKGFKHPSIVPTSPSALPAS